MRKRLLDSVIGFFSVDGFRGGRRRLLLASLLGVLFLVAALWQVFAAAPSNFPLDTLVRVQKGTSISQASNELEEKGVVGSSLMLKVLVKIFGGSRGVTAGDYVFHTPKNVFGVARSLISGAYGVELRKITIPEGTNVTQIAGMLDTFLIDFDAEAFIAKAKPFEGYLFPDTYYFYENASPDTVIETMRNNFEIQLKEVAPQIAAYGRDLDDVIIMASLIEEEARTNETRRTIAGILWKRLDKGMPLQVDAVFQYLIGKGSADLTLDDLALNSPYNTYTHKGLPPGPITNPGLNAIINTVTPIATPYYFYLSDEDGEMHYAATFELHKRNKERYIP